MIRRENKIKYTKESMKQKKEGKKSKITNVRKENSIKFKYPIIVRKEFIPDSNYEILSDGAFDMKSKTQKLTKQQHNFNDQQEIITGPPKIMYGMVRKMETNMHTKARVREGETTLDWGRLTASPLSACLTHGMKISESWLG